MSRSRRRAILPKLFDSRNENPGSGIGGDDVDGVDDRHVTAEDVAKVEDGDDRWSRMLPELLTEIIKRVEVSEDKWPMRKSVVAFACVCRRWRETALEIVRPPLENGRITFPSSLKQPGPRESPIQCFIKRNKKNSTFLLYLSLTPQTSTDVGKFLLAARRTRRGGRFEYVISLDADDFSQGSNTYVGKLRSDFLGTKFTIYDSLPPFEGAKASSHRASRRFSFKQISPSPQVSAGNFEIGNLSYKFNILKSRGPRRMACSLQFPSNEESHPTMNDILNKSNKMNDVSNSIAPSFAPSSLVLKNKAPRWHEHLQCWCLNFHGRVTVASVKNFQLVATQDPSQPGNVGDEETVLLQFGKVGDDLFTMDYRQPLSAFQAFALCLTSFGTKFACE